MCFSFEEDYVLKLQGRLYPEFAWKAMRLSCEENYRLKLRGRLCTYVASNTIG